jgi:hypothetical protein
MLIGRNLTSPKGNIVGRRASTGRSPNVLPCRELRRFVGDAGTLGLRLAK